MWKAFSACSTTRGSGASGCPATDFVSFDDLASDQGAGDLDPDGALLQVDVHPTQTDDLGGAQADQGQEHHRVQPGVGAVHEEGLDLILVPGPPLLLFLRASLRAARGTFTYCVTFLART